MRFVHFLVFVFFLLLGGCHYRFAKIRHSGGFYPSALFTAKVKSVELAKDQTNGTEIAAATTPPGTQYIFSAEDDDDITFSKRYVLLTNCLFLLAIAPWLIHFYRSFPNRQLRAGLVPHIAVGRYILQQALRI